MLEHRILVLCLSLFVACTSPPTSGGGGRNSSCTPGEFACQDGQRRLCADNGRSWATLPCDGQTVCYGGQCVPPAEVPEAGQPPRGDTGSVARADTGSSADSGGLSDTAMRPDVGANAPVAVPAVKLIDGNANYRRNDDGDPQAAPLSTVTVTGENSRGLGGARITDYEWSLSQEHGASVPAGSGVRLRTSDAMETDFVYGAGTAGLDSAGVYNVALRVRDERRNWSAWSILTLESKPDSAIHIELTWDHASADVDIHLIRAADPSDYTSDQDCYYLNCNTSRSNGRPRLSWGPGGEEDDPRLDLDDVNGFGPENINIEEPEVPQSYLVGVYYYRADGTGAERATVATLRIYIGGRLAYEEAAELADTQAWWEPATIMWGEANPILRRGRLEATPPN